MEDENVREASWAVHVINHRIVTVIKKRSFKSGSVVNKTNFDK